MLDSSAAGPTVADVVGSCGVTLLLVAFALHSFGRISAESRWYGVLNVVGAAMAAIASALIDYLPFVVLETTWCVVALARLVRPAAKRP